MRGFRITSLGLVAGTLGLGSDLPAQARVGFYGGLAIATLGGEDAGSPGSRSAAHGGGFVAFQLTSVVALQPGLAWVQKGIEEELDPDLTVRVALSYLELPLLARFSIPSNVRIAAHGVIGPVVSFEMGCAVEAESQQGGTTSADCDSPLLGGGVPTKSSDVGLLLGGGVTLAPRNRVSVMLQVAYELGLTSIDDSDPPFDVKHRVVLLSAGVTFALGR